jgi:Na+/H+ antiporter NhaA
MALVEYGSSWWSSTFGFQWGGRAFVLPLGIAVKSEAYSWRQLCGAGAVAGIGFTVSLFIAGEAFPDPMDYTAAKIAIFLASFVAGGLGAVILWPRKAAMDAADDAGVHGHKVASMNV